VTIVIHNRFLDINWQSRLRLLELKLGLGKLSHWLLRVTWNMPIADTTKLLPTFVRKSHFTSRYIVHPEGGGAARLVCEECGSDQPYGANPHPCPQCAVPKESGVMICLAHRTWRWSWSDWGWAVKDCGRWVVAEGSMDDKWVWRPIRFHSLRRAQAAVDAMNRERLDLIGKSIETDVLVLGCKTEIVLYPIKSAVAMTMPGASAYDDPSIRIVKV